IARGGAAIIMLLPAQAGAWRLWRVHRPAGRRTGCIASTASGNDALASRSFCARSSTLTATIARETEPELRGDRVTPLAAVLAYGLLPGGGGPVARPPPPAERARRGGRE